TARDGLRFRHRAVRLLRRGDQPRAEGRDRFRPQGRAVLDAVPRLLGSRRHCRAERRLVAAFLRRHAPVRLTVRLPELHRRRPGELAARVLRLQPSAPAENQAPLRPAERLPLAAEHQAESLSGNVPVTTVPRPGGLITKRVPPAASARSRRPSIPEPARGSAPPRPSSLISKRSTSPSRANETSARVACACFVTFVSASEQM